MNNYNYIAELTNSIVNEDSYQQKNSNKSNLSSLIQVHSNTQELLSSGVEALTNTAVLSYGGNKQEEKTSPGVQLHARTGDGKNYRIYFSANTNIISPYFQNKFCVFLNSLTAENSVVIELGSGIGGTLPNTQLGMMISSMNNTKCQITTLAAGRCSFTESCLFIFGQNRIISPYGALQYTGLKVYDSMLKDYAPYFTYMFKEAKERNIIKEEHYNLLTTTGKSVMRTYNEFIVP